MRAFLTSSLFWRMAGGFAFGTVLTLGLGLQPDAAPVSTTPGLEIVS